MAVHSLEAEGGLTLSLSNDFKNISIALLSGFASSNEVVISEFDLFLVICKWLEHNAEYKGTLAITRIFSRVYFDLFEPADHLRMLGHDVVPSSVLKMVMNRSACVHPNGSSGTGSVAWRSPCFWLA